MAHFAGINADNIVERVVVIRNEDILDETGAESEAVGAAFCQKTFGFEHTWIQTSFNGRIRKNYAGVGYSYDLERDAFIPPKPYPSWLLNEESCLWEAPVPYPDDGERYTWDEEAQAWVPTEI